MKVAWDEDKNAANQRKHQLSFEEAQHVFSSDDYLEVFDQEHSDTEERFIAIGLINRGLIVVVWTQTEENEIWIMSALRNKARSGAL